MDVKLWTNIKENTRKWKSSKSSVLAIRAYWIQVKLKSTIFVAINVIVLSQVKLLARHTVKRGVINATYMKCHTFFPKGIPLKVTLKASARKMYFLACKDDMIFGKCYESAKNYPKWSVVISPECNFCHKKNHFPNIASPTTNNLTYT